MFLDASVWQMVRGAIVVFTAGLSVVFLKRRLYIHHIVGLVVVVTGLLLVGYAALADSHSSSGQRRSGSTLLGLMLTLVSQLVSASQSCFEEYLLKGRSVSAKRTVGMEGFWGIIIQGILLFVFCYIPGSDHGSYENISDSVGMYTQGGCLIINILTCLYMVSIALYNFVGLEVTKRISAVTRCLVDSCRTLVVWIVSMALYYGGYERYGSPWIKAND